jgi:hypothetical protein
LRRARADRATARSMSLSRKRHRPDRRPRSGACASRHLRCAFLDAARTPGRQRPRPVQLFRPRRAGALELYREDRL